MREISLDGARMGDRASAHAYLKSALDLPDYYGANLDALWDCLSSDSTPRRIIIFNAKLITASLGDYGESLLALFQELAEANPSILISIE